MVGRHQTLTTGRHESVILVLLGLGCRGRYSVYTDSHRMLKAGRGREDAFVEMRSGGGGDDATQPAVLLEIVAHEQAGLTHAFVKVEWHQSARAHAT